MQPWIHFLLFVSYGQVFFWFVFVFVFLFQKGASLLRTKCTDKMGPASAVDQPPDRPGKADCFHGLIANFYSVKAKKIPAGNLA